MSEVQEIDKLKQLTMVVYILHAASFLLGFTSIIAVVINYIKRDEVRGTWLESHFNWQIKTFWIMLIVGFVGFLLSFVLIGIPILIGLTIWYIYRIVKGFLALNDGKPVGLPA